MSFAIGNRFLLTYLSLLPADSGDDDICQLIDDFDDYFLSADHYRTCLERHRDGSYHIHALLFYKKIQHIPHNRYFGINKHHCEIPNTKCDLERLLKYLAKEGEYWGDLSVHHHMTTNDVYMHAMVSHNTQEAWTIIQHNAPQDYFQSHIIYLSPPISISGVFGLVITFSSSSVDIDNCIYIMLALY